MSYLVTHHLVTWLIFYVDEYVDHTQMTKGTYSKPGWFNAVKEEYKACKERVCLVDMSSFTKIEIKVSFYPQ